MLEFVSDDKQQPIIIDKKKLSKFTEKKPGP